MSKQTLEPLFRMALSRLEQADDEMDRITAIFPTTSIDTARIRLSAVIDDLRAAQEFAASEYGFEVLGSMPT